MTSQMTGTKMVVKALKDQGVDTVLDTRVEQHCQSTMKFSNKMT